MMSAQEYRTRAEALIRSTHEVTDFALVLEMESTAAEWRKLALLAEAQDVLRSVLAVMSDRGAARGGHVAAGRRG